MIHGRGAFPRPEPLLDCPELVTPIGRRVPGFRDVSAADQVERLAKAPLAFQPGTAWEHSLATDLLGRVVEAVAGARLSQVVEERVLGPLQMRDSGFWVPKEKLARLAEPLPVDPATGNPTRVLDVSARPRTDSGGAGGVTTATDYLRFAQMMPNGGRLDGARIVSRSTVALMTSDHAPAQARPQALPRTAHACACGRW